MNSKWLRHLQSPRSKSPVRNAPNRLSTATNGWWRLRRGALQGGSAPIAHRPKPPWTIRAHDERARAAFEPLARPQGARSRRSIGHPPGSDQVSEPLRAGSGQSPATSSAHTDGIFRRFSQATATVTGSSWAFIVAVLVILSWGASGPLFKFSDTWQLVINTSTTIVTFLMVFLIQNTQNRDARAMHLKLDELVRAVGAARNQLIDVEEADDASVAQLTQEFQKMHVEGPG